MNHFRIHILFQFREAPWGGGNQFLKALRKYFNLREVYENDPTKADVILFNSHHCLGEVLKLKREHPEKILIHRVDGPVRLVRGNGNKLDNVIFAANKSIADGTIFQSEWSKKKCHEQVMGETGYQRVIHNAPDSEVFSPQTKNTGRDHKTRIIVTSWSSNMNKGFEIYKFLDENLDFGEYEVTFVGNSPISFKNIRSSKPLSSTELASTLRNHDLYLIASKDDPCSNALIEALHCGLPVVARNSGGHPEIVKSAGKLFENQEDVMSAIEKVAKDSTTYRSKIEISSMKTVGNRYFNFANKIYTDVLSGNYIPKRATVCETAALKYKIMKVFLHQLKKHIASRW
jgi:glycosyltransferase involved in cell wall biosynthesis